LALAWRFLVKTEVGLQTIDGDVGMTFWQAKQTERGQAPDPLLDRTRQPEADEPSSGAAGKPAGLTSFVDQVCVLITILGLPLLVLGYLVLLLVLWFGLKA
jgi:hypothetical protein